MIVVKAALLGALGAALHDVFELISVFAARRGELPPEWRTFGFFAASLLRLLAGAGLAAFVAAVEPLGALGSVLIGVLGPLLLQRIAGLLFDTGHGRN